MSPFGSLPSISTTSASPSMSASAAPAKTSSSIERFLFQR
jgi:hypothetical protein